VVVLVVGPSGVGKSECGKHAGDSIEGCSFYDLDALIRERSGMQVTKFHLQVGDDGFLDHCRQAVGALMASCTDGIAVVAVGAGALQSLKAKERGGRRNIDRTFDAFYETEYSKRRLDIYSVPRYTCSVAGLSLEEAKGRFVEVVKGIGKAMSTPPSIISAEALGTDKGGGTEGTQTPRSSADGYGDPLAGNLDSV
jgi:hypothetical protein